MNRKSSTMMYWFLALLLLLPLISLAQVWKLQISKVNVELTDVCFINQSQGWAAGDNGVLLATTNGGLRWEPKETGTLRDITRVIFVDKDHGWFVTVINALYKTTDGGDSWEELRLTLGLEIAEIFFINSSTGWASIPAAQNGAGKIYKSTNGGKGWQLVLDLPSTATNKTSFRGIEFLNENIGFAVGADGFFDNYNSGRIWRTTNGGADWTFVHSRTGPIRPIAVYKPTTVLTGSFSGLHSSLSLSTNGGQNWEDLKHQKGLFVGSSTATCVELSTPRTLWAFVIDMGERIIVSRDFGNNWESSPRAGDERVNKICFSDETHGWAVGPGGSIWRYDPTEDAIDDVLPAPPAFSLFQNYPNPFTSSTAIAYELAAPAFAALHIYNAVGMRIATLVETTVRAGLHSIDFNTSELPAGIYYYRLFVNNSMLQKKMTVVK